MNKKIIGLLIFLMLFFQIQPALGLTQDAEMTNESVESGNIDEDIVTMINQVNESLISRYLEELVEFGPRYTGSESCSKAAEYIYHEFESLGLDVYYDHYKFYMKKNKRRIKIEDKNVVATLNGTDPNSDAIFILCAHYDTTKTSPGANDDGSGVATMLAIANICSQYSFNHTIRFIAFSGEEVGVYGSNAYAKQAYEKGDNIRAVLNLETFGYTSPGDGELFILKTERTEWISYLTQEIAEKYYQLIGLTIVPNGNRPCDHQPFLDYGYDAVQYVQLNRDDYPLHTPEDSLDKINFSYLVNVTKLILAITAELADKPIELQVRIITPYEGHVYIMDKPVIRLPGFNTANYGIRGMTYILGKAIIRVNITTKSEIERVFFCIDGISDWYGECKQPPYEWEIKKSIWSKFPLKGKHKISVYVWTENGEVAYDEMDIFIFTLF